MTRKARRIAGWRLIVGIGLVATAVFHGVAHAADPAPRLDLQAWQEIPVFHEGRIKPLDTYARSVVRTICGRENPRLSSDDAQEASPEMRAMFPNGQARKFSAAELLFRWLTEPEKWERVPFLAAGNEELRETALGVPLVDRQGNRLRYVSPYDVVRSERFAEYVEAMHRRQEGGDDASAGVAANAKLDAEVQKLESAYTLFRIVSFNPTVANRGAQQHFQSRLASAVSHWPLMVRELEQLNLNEVRPEAAKQAGRLKDAIVRLADAFRAGEGDAVLPDRVEPVLPAVREAARELAKELKALQSEQAAAAKPLSETQCSIVNRIAYHASSIARLSFEAHLGIYDSRHGLQIVPSLNASALELNRDTSDPPQPWLSLPAVLYGSERLLQTYPQTELSAVRKAFRDATTSHQAAEANASPERTAAFQAALQQFADSVRRMAEAVEPLRAQLPVHDPDPVVLAATKYPAPGAVRFELTYNRVDPFGWAWIFGLAGAALLFNVFFLSRPSFWAGLLALLTAEGFLLFGFVARFCITGWVPVSNMFESIIFMTIGVVPLAVWFAFQPVVGGALETAWRWTAVPVRKTPDAAGGESQPNFGLLVVARIVVTAAALAALVWVNVRLWSTGSRAAYSLLPHVALGDVQPDMGAWLIWLVKLAVWAVGLWWVPRAGIALIAAACLLPGELRRTGRQESMERVVMGRHRWFLTAAAAVVGIAAFTACHSALFNRDIGTIQPILRDNFWLVAHVITIMSSYGAGALAWVLGNVALGFYLFGSYRRPQGDSPFADAATRLPPEACAELSAFIYRLTQVAVLLLIFGTILGGLWADVAWGRFWGWDPKEVWALISLLVYLTVLHGRFTGWFRDFGMAIGAVLGGIAILLAWYGVNFVFGSGLHSYGSGEGNYVPLAVVAGLNGAWAFAASFRYLLMTASSRH